MPEEATRDIAPAPAAEGAREPAPAPALDARDPSSSPARLRRRLARIPSPLAALLGASLLLTIAWSFAIPPFHAPDEDEHYVYVQSLAEDLRLPPAHSFATPGAQLTPGLRLAEAYGKTHQFWKPQQVPVRPPWNRDAERAFAAAFRKLTPAQRRHVDSAVNQGGDPPLYHAYEAIAYRITPSASPFARLLVMRLWSSLLVLLTVTGAWLLAGELFGRNRMLQLLTAGCVGLQPMITFMSSGVNPDAGAFAGAAFVLWLGVRVLRRGPTRANVIGLLVALALTALVKTSLLTLAPAVLIALVLAARRSGVRVRRGWRSAVVVGVGLAAVVALGLVATGRALRFLAGGSKLGAFLSYLWQYYLPRLPSQSPVPGLPRHAFYTVWLRGSWAEFGWSEIHFPASVYRVLALVTAVIFVAAVVGLLRRRAAIERAILAFFAAATIGLVLGLHVADYYAVRKWGGPLLQGRYILAVLPIAGVAAAFAVTNLRARWRPVATAAMLGGLLAFNLASLALVAGAFYV